MHHYSQFDEDTWLWERLGHIPHGRYIDVGANDPQVGSVSYAFYEMGWAGVTVEPMPRYADLHRQMRPDDRLVQAVVTNTNGSDWPFFMVGGRLTGLSTLHPNYAHRYAQEGLEVQSVAVPGFTLDAILHAVGWEPGLDIHFAKIDVEGAEPMVFEGFTLADWQPWYLVVEAVEPFQRTPNCEVWEPMVLAAGYELAHDDGVNRFYQRTRTP